MGERVRVGHSQRIGDGWATGVTVVLPPPGTTAGVDVRGGGPGTRETDVLDPSNLVEHVDAVVLTGGSAYGLATADGVLRWLAGRHRGFPVGPEPRHVVPIVPAAVLFDLPLGDWSRTPGAAAGAEACEDALTRGDAPRRAAHRDDAAPPDPASVFAGAVPEGSVGAGAGAVAGRLKGGVGVATTTTASGHAVGAVVAVNAIGHVVDPATGVPWVTDGVELEPPHAAEIVAAPGPDEPRWSLNTTIGVIATDAALSKAQCRRVATTGHDGIARAVRPAHTLHDGDTLFALATGTGAAPDGPAGVDEIAIAAADVVARAITRAVLLATSVPGSRAYRDVFPSAVWRLS